MKRAQIIGLSVALGAGGLAFFMARSMLKPPPPPVIQTEKVDAVQVLVARADIGLGSVANEQSFRWQDWPREAVSPAFITKNKQPNAVRDMSGSIARSPVLTGEPITTTKLIKSGSGGVLAAILPTGMRAVSTKISEVSAAGKMILPNDRVDVILTARSRSRGGTDEINSDTILRNVRVLAIGQMLEVKEGKKNAEGNVATLELSPAQAETLALANMRGELSLALRSIADLDPKLGPMSDEVKRDRGTAVRILRYGQKQRAYGVN